MPSERTFLPLPHVRGNGVRSARRATVHDRGQAARHPRIDLPEQQEERNLMDDGEHVCSLCGQTFTGWGNNPEPLATFEERCCDQCNRGKVIPARLAGWEQTKWYR